MDLADAFGTVLRRLRTERSASQESLAGDAGLQRKYISLLEQGAYQPKLATVFQLAKALGIRPSQLVAMVDEERQMQPPAAKTKTTVP